VEKQLCTDERLAFSFFPYCRWRSIWEEENLGCRITSQLFFDPTSIAYLYTNNAPYNTRPTPDTSNTSDMVYNTATSDGSIAGPRLVLSLNKASSGNGYTATFNVYVPAAG